MSDQSGPVKRPGLRIGRVFSVPVIISPTWLIMAVLVTVIYSDVVRGVLPRLPETLVYLVSFGFVITLFGSVFLHELGHALVSRYYRIPVRSITLEMLGGHTEMGSEAPSPKVEALVSLAGPAVSAALGLIGIAAVILTEPHTIGAQFAFQLAASNILVAVYNVLPGLPLDGGRALRALVWAIKGDKHLASRVAGWVGRIVAFGTAASAAMLYFAGWVSILAVAFGFMIGVVLWIGATRAIQIGTLGARFHLLQVANLTRRAAKIASGTPLAEALRQIQEQQAYGAFVVDGQGRALSLMSSASVAAVPAQRRPWVSIDDVSRRVTDDISWEPTWHGEQVIAAMRRHPATEYAVILAGKPLGIVRSADIADVLDPSRRGADTDDFDEVTGEPVTRQQEDPQK